MSDNTNKAAYLSIKLLKELSLTKSPAITCLLGKTLAFKPPILP